MDLYDRLAARIRAQDPVAVATVIEGPRLLGAKMLIGADGSHEGSLGLSALDVRVGVEARELLRYERSESRAYPLEGEDTTVRVFIESHSPPPTLVIVGAGHTSIPLSSIARISGYHVVLIDARAAFANRDRFPDPHEIVVGWPHEVLAARQITAATYVAVLTHDAKFEEPLLPVLLRSQARYLGVIGSRRTQLQRRERLRGEGFSEEDIKRLSGPIGLDIGAVTPEEIAIGIMAEIVAKRHGRPGGFLSDTLPAAMPR